MKLETLEQLYVDQLKDLYSAEGQLVRALPKIIKAASSERLKQAVSAHLQETKDQRDALASIFEKLGVSPRGKKCKAMEGLVEEGAEAIEDSDEGPVRDAALIAAAQRVEHYEIASYGTVCEYAQVLGRDDDYRALSKILDQEHAADEKLSALATSDINGAARAAVSHAAA
jgi:ferritin-like metal-binding protein YciE